MNRPRPMIILLCLYLFHIISNYIWLKIDTTYLLFDSAQYHVNSLVLFEAIRNSPLACFFLSFGRSGLFVYFITAPFYFLFGTSQDTAVMISSSIFLAILLLSVYGIGRKLQDERAGLLGAFIVSMYPIVFNHLRLYMFDLPLCALVSLNIYLLICTGYFTKKIPTVLYILSIIFGSLIKFNFLVFIIGPAILFLLKKPRENILPRKSFIVLFVIATVLLLIFGINSLRQLFFHIVVVSWVKNASYYLGAVYAEKIILLIVIWCYGFLSFIVDLINNSLSFFFLLIFFIALFITLKLKFKHITFLLLPILVPLFFVIFVFNTVGLTERYMLPSYVFIGLITSIGIMNIRVIYFRRIATILILLIGFIQYFTISYGCKFLPREIRIDLPYFLTQPPAILKKAISGFFYRPPGPYFKSIILFRNEIPIIIIEKSSHPQKDYYTGQIVNKILKNCPVEKTDSFVFIDYCTDVAEILYPLKFEFFLKTKFRDIISGIFFLEYNTPPYKYTPLWQYLFVIDYIAVINDTHVPVGSDLMYLPALKEEIRKTKEYFFRCLDLFELVCEVRLRDGRILSIYRNIINRIKDGSLEIKIRKKTPKIFYQGKPITEDMGLSSYFRYNQKYYSPYDSEAIWQIEKPKPNCLTLHLNWPSLDISQIWELRLENSQINWKVYLHDPRQLLLEDLGVEARLVSTYCLWQDCFNAGQFPEILRGARESKRINRDVFPGINLAILPEQNSLPSLLLQSQQESCLRSIDLYTLCLNQKKIRMLDFNLLPPNPDNPLIFSGKFYLSTNYPELKKALKPSFIGNDEK